ncbi:MAG: hypothetical protein CMN98_03030 [Synechococcus sp. NP17]|nr:hypothetical protein [Synechococcus sp. NP17]
MSCDAALVLTGSLIQHFTAQKDERADELGVMRTRFEDIASLLLVSKGKAECKPPLAKRHCNFCFINYF